MEHLFEFLSEITEKINSGALLTVFGIIIVLIIVLKKSLNNLVTDIPKYFKWKKEYEDEKEEKEEKEDSREQLSLTIDKLYHHELFIELELQKRILDKVFETDGKVDISKTLVFEAFVEEKMNSVHWSQTRMLDTYKIEKEKLEKEGLEFTNELLKTHILNWLMECDDNLECSLSSRLSDMGVPEDKILLIIGKFGTVRSKTLKNYTHRIERMFSPSGNYRLSNEFLILTMFEIISFEISGMVRDITEAFDSVNGAFVKFKLKK